MERPSNRSYSLRGDRMTRAQSLAMRQYWDQYSLSAGQELILNQIFPQKERVILEIGSGMGEATAQIAGHPALCALGFGAEDYSGAIGVHPHALALTWPAQQVITGAHAYGLQCWGMAGSIAEVKDLDAFGKDVEFARSIGFTGSVCIHPNQVAIVNRGFSPSASELEWAQKVVEADQAARAKGLGALLLEGKMIDKPIVDRARRWLAARMA